jgi:hypothetical protein
MSKAVIGLVGHVPKRLGDGLMALFRCPDKADHGLRHFIEVDVDQVRQSSASSFEAMPVEPTRSQNTTVSGGVDERWLQGPAATSTKLS